MSYGKNGRILIGEIPTNPLGVSCHIWNIFGQTENEKRFYRSQLEDFLNP